ncbi:MAG: Xaa-Pro peptidase family protein [Candidatus Bathyarchaeia archaeon]
MLNDIDAEMQRRHIDGMVVLGDTTLSNPDLTYVVGGSLARGGIYFKRVSQSPLLLTSSLDIQKARKLGRVKKIQTYTDHDFEKLTMQYGRTEAYPRLINHVLKELGIEGKIVLAGRNDLASGIHLFSTLRTFGRDITGEASPTILEHARETKSSEEITKIRTVGTKTARVVNSVLDILKDAKRKHGHLWIGKKHATVGSIRKLIATRFAMENLTAPEGTIFATGGSSADPHSSGIPSAEIKEGRLIVFDIFPQSESGYWFDLTRSFTIGKADRKARHMFEAVNEAQDAALGLLRDGLPGDEAMSRACDIIERNGFRTLRDIYQRKMSEPASGFVHSLGHGVGLTIGERPYLTFQVKDRLRKGQVVTVEPGVYLPGFGGVRIEDTVTITERGYRNLSHVPKMLEL